MTQHGRELQVTQAQTGTHVEFVKQDLGVDLLDGHLVLLAPGDRDAGIQVIDLACAK
jgi:hypothetical protein